MKQKLFLTLVMLLTVCSFSRAKEAYAVYDSGDQTLTFRYDDDWGNQPTSVYKYKLNTGSNTPGWIAEGKLFKRVIFISSFADYRPTSTYKWFYNQTELTTFTGLNYLKTNNVTDMSFMFFECTGLTSLNLNGWNTSNVKNMNLIFYNCRGLTSLNLSSWNTGNVEAMEHMFNGCSGLTSINISGWNTENVEYMEHMFNGCSGLTSLNLSSWNTGNVEAMEHMFNGCSGLTSINISGWNTENVEYMEHMFNGCSGLTSLNISGWNTGKVHSMSSMFKGCSGLTSLDVSGFNTANVTDMSSMFYECKNLTSLNLSSFNTANVTNMSNMFYKCSGLTSLDISNFNTANVTDMSFMFFECTGLTSLDLSSFDTSNVMSMKSMFFYCRNLKTIYAGDGWNTDKVDQSGNLYGLFYECNALVGGEGTTFDSSHATKVYARIDGGPTSATPGYFTVKVYDLKIAGTEVTSMNKSDVLSNGGTVKFDGNKTLTLENADISINVTNGFGIDNEIADLVVVATGTNTVNSYRHTACYTGKDISFTGDGTLTLNGVRGGLSSGSKKIMVMDGIHLICLSNQLGGIEGHRNIKDNCVTTLEMSGANTILEAESPNGSLTDIKALSLSDGLGICSPTGAVFGNNAVCDASGNVITSRVIIKNPSGIATGEVLPLNDNGEMINDKAGSWYTIDGRKLSGKPTKMGIYIVNGKKVVIK